MLFLALKSLTVAALFRAPILAAPVAPRLIQRNGDQATRTISSTPGPLLPRSQTVEVQEAPRHALKGRKKRAMSSNGPMDRGRVSTPDSRAGAEAQSSSDTIMEQGNDSELTTPNSSKAYGMIRLESSKRPNTRKPKPNSNGLLDSGRERTYDQWANAVVVDEGDGMIHYSFPKAAGKSSSSRPTSTIEARPTAPASLERVARESTRHPDRPTTSRPDIHNALSLLNEPSDIQD